MFTDVGEGTFDVLDTGKRRTAADVVAIEGEKSSTMLAAMVRTVWLYENRPEFNWSGGAAGVSNHQIVQTLERHPKLRDYLGLGEQIAGATGMIKSAAGAASYLVGQANRRADLGPWYEGVIDGAGLVRSDPRLAFRRVMFNMARRHARAGAAPPRHPRTRRAVPDRVQRLGHRPADRPAAVHPPGHRPGHRQSGLNPNTRFTAGRRATLAPIAEKGTRRTLMVSPARPLFCAVSQRLGRATCGLPASPIDSAPGNASGSVAVAGRAAVRQGDPLRPSACRNRGGCDACKLRGVRPLAGPPVWRRSGPGAAVGTCAGVGPPLAGQASTVTSVRMRIQPYSQAIAGSGR